MLRTLTVVLTVSLVTAIVSAQNTTPNVPTRTPPTRERTAPKPATDTGAKTPESASKDIVETAIAAGSFKTLTAALQAAGLVDTLKGKGPFTVFAPTDEAFAKLPTGTVDDLMKPENKAKLTALLTYHVVPMKVTAADAMKLPFAKTLQGQRVDIKANDGKVMIDSATVTKADIAASNGVIHVIDRVIMPIDGNAYEVARGVGSFGTLLAAVDASGMAELFKAPGQFTLLAPTDEAFRALPKGTLEMLLKPENRTKLAEVLAMHVIPGIAAYSDQVASMGETRTATGAPLKIVSKDGKVTIGSATVVKADVEASNAVIHVIDHVILPPSMSTPNATATGTEKPAHEAK